MAQRRMFSLKIVDTDLFLDMPVSARLLYYDLAMRADDDGFVASPKKIQRMIGCSDDDFKLLIAKQFIIPFENGVCVIKHWRIHNYIRPDRYTETIYKDEKQQLIEENNRYEMSNLGILNSNLSTGKPNVIPMVSTSKDRIGKFSLGKFSLGKDNLNIERIIIYWNSVSTKKVIKLTEERRKSMEYLLDKYKIDEIREAINNINKSKYLQEGIEFDWFIKEDNFLNVLENKYKDKIKSSKDKGLVFNNFEARKKSDRYIYLQEQCLLGQATEEEKKEYDQM